MLYIFLSIIVILQIYFIFFIKNIFFVNDNKENQDKIYLEKLEKNLREELAKEFSRSRIENNSVQKDSRDEIRNNLALNIEKLAEVVEKRLYTLQESNTEKLDRMRETVDEKLHATLEKRFGESFKIVSERLEMVHKGLGEMQAVAIGVGDLKRVLTNVKNRGIWGEVQLESLIEEMLTTDQYEKNMITKKGSANRVEFAIKLPSKSTDTDHIYMPIDAKFPLSDYEEYIQAMENGVEGASESFNKNLSIRIKNEAKDIRDKYIDTPYTTDFGILFLPVESLFAEVLRIPGLFETIRREYKVIITGPTTIQAILNSLQMGFRTLTIQKRSSEIFELLGVVKKEFGLFGVLLEKTHKKIMETGNAIEDAMSKTRGIEKKLNKVSKLELKEDTNNTQDDEGFLV